MANQSISFKSFSSFVPCKRHKIINPLQLKWSKRWLLKRELTLKSTLKGYIPAVTLFQSSFESVTWDRKLYESPVLPHPPDPDSRSVQLFHHFPPVSPLLQLQLILAQIADPKPQTRGGKYGLIFTAFHSRKAECFVNWYAPVYPLHRPDNVFQRRNLTSSRLDPTEQRTPAGNCIILKLCPKIRETSWNHSDLLFLFFLRFSTKNNCYGMSRWYSYRDLTVGPLKPNSYYIMGRTHFKILFCLLWFNSPLIFQ